MRVIGWDTETHAIEDHVPVPTQVCFTAAGGADTFDLIRAWDPRCEELASDQPFESVHPDLWLRVRYIDGAMEWELCILRDRSFDLLAHLLLAADDIIFAAHFQVFDWMGMVHRNPELEPLLWQLIESGRAVCTKIREQLWAIATDNFQFDQRIRRPVKGFSLAHCVEARFSVDLSADKKDPNSWRLRYKELDSVPLDQWPRKALTYAAEDATWARRVYLDQATPLELPEGTVVREDGTVVNEREQCAFDWVLYHMRCNGVRTDNDAVDAFADEVAVMVEEATWAGRKAGFMVINRCTSCLGTGWAGEVPHLEACALCDGLDHEALLAAGRYGTYKNGKAKTPKAPTTAKSTKRLKALVEHGYGGHPPRTDKGSTKTDADTLAASGNPLLVTYSEGSFAIKLRDTYLPILRNGTHHAIHSSPQVLVRSGRTSWRKPNLQNPPGRGGFRECFVPQPGNVFCSVDWSTLELGTLAQTNLILFGYSRMAEAINDDKDLHLAFACDAYLHDLTYEEALAILNDPEHPRYDEVKDARTRAKPANFGFPGMLGVQAFCEYAQGYGLDISFNDGEDLKNAWFATWEEMQDYKEDISSRSRRSPDGRFALRQHGSGRIRGGCSFTSGANTRFQGLAADGAKAAGWALHKETFDPTSPLFGVKMWAFIHDEYMFEGPEATAHLWAARATEIMIREMSRYTPDVKVGAEPALMRRWSKKAKAVYDENNRLVPYD